VSYHPTEDPELTPPQLQLNLENAENTYGKSSSPCQIIQKIIDDFTAKHQLAGHGQSSPPLKGESPRLNGLQLPFRPKTG
jgi:hypothetical protein